MTSSKETHKTQAEENVIIPPKDHISSKPKMSFFCKAGLENICAVTAGGVIITLLSALLVFGLKKTEEPQKENPSRSSQKTSELSSSLFSNQSTKSTLEPAAKSHDKDQAQSSDTLTTIDQTKKRAEINSSPFPGSSDLSSLSSSSDSFSSPSQEASLFAKAQDKKLTRDTEKQEMTPQQRMAEMAHVIATLENKIQRLEERLFILEKIQARAPQVWETYHKFQTALSSGAPFEEELDEIKKLTGHNVKIAKAIKILETHAKSGVPNIEKLRTSFKEVRIEIVTLFYPPHNLSWWEKMIWHLKNSVKISREDEEEQEDSQASPLDILDRASLDISRGHFRQAIDLLSSLKQNDGSNPKLEGWLAQAIALEKIHEARHFLKNHMILEMISPQ